MHTDSAKYFNINVISKPDFPGGSVVKNSLAKQEMWVWYGGWEDPLEKGMETCSSILAWENPGTGESGGLLSTGVAKESDMTSWPEQQTTNKPQYRLYMCPSIHK